MIPASRWNLTAYSANSSYRCTGAERTRFCLSCPQIRQTPEATTSTTPLPIVKYDQVRSEMIKSPSDFRHQIFPGWNGCTTLRPLIAVTKRTAFSLPPMVLRNQEKPTSIMHNRFRSVWSFRYTITVQISPIGAAATDSPVVMGPKDITLSRERYLGSWLISMARSTRSGTKRGRWMDNFESNLAAGDGDFFDIDDNGVLYFTQPPDFEDPADDNGDNVYNLRSPRVEAYDSNPRGVESARVQSFPNRVNRQGG